MIAGYTLIYRHVNLRLSARSLKISRSSPIVSLSSSFFSQPFSSSSTSTTQQLLFTLKTSLPPQEPLVCKNSKFIASLASCQSFKEAQTLHLPALRLEHPKASHVTYAFVSNNPIVGFRISDDNEVAGTAGQPILQAIQCVGLTNVLLSVTRYYGGTKLGVGGLIRAYGQAAREVLKKADEGNLITPKRTVRYVSVYGLMLDEIGGIYSQVNSLPTVTLISEDINSLKSGGCGGHNGFGLMNFRFRVEEEGGGDDDEVMVNRLLDGVRTLSKGRKEVEIVISEDDENDQGGDDNDGVLLP
jgi:putative IMPACT (imprinted ancient) family translation regulator